MAHDLIFMLRDDGTDQIDYLINVVRATDSVEEIAMAISANLREEREGTSNAEPLQGLNGVLVEKERGSYCYPSKKRKVISIQSLADNPIYDLPAKPWTAITDDNRFVSHLVSLYFTWEHAGYHLLDCEAFLDDMKSQQLGAEACSPFLVNALLAAACVSGTDSQSGARTDSGRSFPIIQKHVLCLKNQILEGISFLTKRSVCGKLNKVLIAWLTSRAYA